MSDTIDKGAAMTAAEIKRRLAGIKEKLTPGAWVQTSVDPDDLGGVRMICYPYGVLDRDSRQCFRGDAFEAVMLEAEEWAAAYGPTRRDAAIRTLALDIIDLTDQHGKCTVSMLRGRGHSQDDIDTYRDAACVRAGEMSGNSPFEVT